MGTLLSEAPARNPALEGDVYRQNGVLDRAEESVDRRRAVFGRIHDGTGATGYEKTPETPGG